MTDAVTPTLKDKERGVYDYTGLGTPTALGLTAPDGTTYDDLTPGGGSKWQRMAGTWAQLSTSTGAVAWASITGKPTTLAGYGITDALSSSYTPAWSTITGKPTTISGYGITDSFTQSLADARYLQLTGGTLTGLVTHTMGTATSNIRATYVSGDTYARWYQNADGSMWWGSGSAAADVSLYRIGANTLGSNGVLRSTSTSGWAIGELPGVPRIRYGAQGANSFDMISSGDGFADLYVANITASSLAVAQNHSVYWPVGGGGWYMSDTTFMRVYGNKMIYASGGVLLDPGNGLQSNASGSATLSFASGAPGYLDFRSGDATVSGIRLYRNGAITGYFYANSNGVSILNDYGQYGLTVNYGNTANPGGSLFGVWNLSYSGATSNAPIAGVVASSVPPTSSNLYPPNTIWLVT